jgi:hypothetical protein
MNRYSHIILPLLLTLPVSATCAEQVYTWVDDSGTTHFSEAPPPDSTFVTQLLEVLPASGAAPSNAPDDGFYSVINQAERMQTRRLENEKLTAERKQADAEASKARAEAQAALQDSYYNDDVSYYPYYPRYRRPWNGHKPHPGHGHRPHMTRPNPHRASLGRTPGMPHY